MRTFSSGEAAALLGAISDAGLTKLAHVDARQFGRCRDAVDAHQVWDLDPDQIEDARLGD